MIKRRILIVDNDEDTLFLIGSALNKAGYISEMCATASGIVEFKHALPDLFILDHELPTIEGIAISKFLRLQESTKTIPIIMISGYQIRNRAKDAGVDKFLMKPFKLDDLVQVVNECLQRHVLNHT